MRTTHVVTKPVATRKSNPTTTIQPNKNLSIKELRCMCKALGLDTSGPKIELRQRLETLAYTDSLQSSISEISERSPEVHQEHAPESGDRQKNDDETQLRNTIRAIQDMEYEASLMLDQCNEPQNQNEVNPPGIIATRVDPCEDMDDTEQDSERLSREEIRLARLSFFENK